MTEQDLERPPYRVPEIGERILAYDGTVLGVPVPATYLGFEHISGDFFMHNVRSDAGVESNLAAHDVHQLRIGPDGERWIPLMGWPTARYGGPKPT